MMALWLCAAAVVAAADVSEAWVARYDGPRNGHDYGRTVAVDPAGNVYVAGYTTADTEIGYLDDYITVKYCPDGVQQWAMVYDGPGNGGDRVRALAVDGAGNVYVTGYSYGTSGYTEYATIKYDTNGVTQWVARYAGPGNRGHGGNAIAVDDAGNVYVTGYSHGSGSKGDDYATIMYSANGVQQWVIRYEGEGDVWEGQDSATAIAVDAEGNVYVTGHSQGLGSELDYATLKYAVGGAGTWVMRYNGTGNGRDQARAVSVDALGNVYVTGRSQNASGLYDYVTIKYDAAGNEQWVQRYNGPAGGTGNAEAYAMAVDGNGDVYVTGAVRGGGGFFDYGTIKYTTLGVEQWVAVYNGPDNSTDYATAIALDSAGSVYVTGQSRGVSTGPDYVTIKYSPEGMAQWTARYVGPWGNDYATAIAVDVEGNVYVTGESLGLENSAGRNCYDIATIKYTPTGVASTLSVALPAVQPAGCLVNRWMPFWLEVRGGCPLESPTQRIHGFEFYLAYDPSVLACDLEGDGSWNDIDFTGTVCQWDCGSGPEGPDLAFLSDVEIEGTRYLHVGVVFDNTPDACEKTLACMAPDGVLARIRVHTLNFPDPQNPGVTATDLSFGTGALLPYYVRHEAGGVPEEVPVAAPAGLAGLEIAAAPLFIRGNATGDADSDPLPAPPADPRSAIDINDGLRILRYLFVDPIAHPIGCMESADANDDARVNLLDAVHVLQWVFGTAADFPAPLSRVGVDDDGDGMDCARSQI